MLCWFATDASWTHATLSVMSLCVGESQEGTGFAISAAPDCYILFLIGNAYNIFEMEPFELNVIAEKKLVTITGFINESE